MEEAHHLESQSCLAQAMDLNFCEFDDTVVESDNGGTFFYLKKIPRRFHQQMSQC